MIVVFDTNAYRDLGTGKAYEACGAIWRVFLQERSAWHWPKRFVRKRLQRGLSGVSIVLDRRIESHGLKEFYFNSDSL